jgi:hypothetical protein
MAIFENPNSPGQPQPGVYVWRAQKTDRETIAIYVGEAGKRTSLFPGGTLFRGVSQVQRSPFTSNSNKAKHSSLDTNFVVGTAIRYFEKEGWVCTWKHISDDPTTEMQYVRREKPILQELATGDIKPQFTMKKIEVGYWQAQKTRAGIDAAEKAIHRALDGAMRCTDADGLISESRRGEEGVPVEEVKADLVKRGRLRD